MDSKVFINANQPNTGSINFKNRIINGDFSVWQRGENFLYGTPATWAASTSYNVGDIVIPSTANGFYYECTVAGTSDSTECTWPTKVGETVTDNTVTWECKGINYLEGKFGFSCDRYVSGLTIDGLVQFIKTQDEGRNVLKINILKDFGDISSNQFHGIEYEFEQQQLYDLYVKKSNITVSFLFKSNISGKFSFVFRNNYYNGDTGDWDSTKTDTYNVLFDYDTPNEFKRIKITIPLDANFSYEPQNLKPENAGFGILIGTLYTDSSVSASDSELNQWNYGVNYISAQSVTNYGVAGNYIEIAELQLEEGNIATEFEQIPYDIQLQRCMRYYEKWDSFYLQPQTNQAANTCYYSFPFKTQKRSIPSIKANIFDNGGIDSIDYSKTTKDLFTIGLSTSNDSSIAWYGANLQFDAEF